MNEMLENITGGVRKCMVRENRGYVNQWFNENTLTLPDGCLLWQKVIIIITFQIEFDLLILFIIR